MAVNRRRAISKWGLILLTFLCITEISLRKYGFCDAVLMREDSAYEYIAIPQDRHRFGKHIFYNSFSQRNPEPDKSDSIRICAFGDSFINGGAALDNDSLATNKLSKYFTAKAKKPVKVLNISAGSWGPDNCYAYLMKHGDFGSKQFILFVSSHDAYDDINFQKVVGINRQYPDRQYKLAIVELTERYIIPRLLSFGNMNEDAEINKQQYSTIFNTGFLNFRNYCDKNDIDFTVYLHAAKTETIEHNNSVQGKQIIAFCKENKIKFINELDFNFPLSVYRDSIHFNDEGQERLFEELRNFIVIK